jgi:hypothetical protein
VALGFGGRGAQMSPLCNLEKSEAQKLEVVPRTQRGLVALTLGVGLGILELLSRCHRSANEKDVAAMDADICEDGVVEGFYCTRRGKVLCA